MPETKKKSKKQEIIKYADILQRLRDMDEGKTDLATLPDDLKQVIADVKGNKVGDSKGNEIKQIEELQKVVDEVKAFKIGLASRTVIEDVIAAYEKKAEKDLGGIISDRIDKLGSALKTPARTLEWAMSDTLSSPNWDHTGEERLEALAEINRYFDELEKTTKAWVDKIQKTNVDDENRRKKSFGDKETGTKGNSPDKKKEWKDYSTKHYSKK